MPLECPRLARFRSIFLRSAELFCSVALLFKSVAFWSLHSVRWCSGWERGFDSSSCQSDPLYHGGLWNAQGLCAVGHFPFSWFWRRNLQLSHGTDHWGVLFRFVLFTWSLWVPLFLSQILHSSPKLTPSSLVAPCWLPQTFWSFHFLADSLAISNVPI